MSATCQRSTSGGKGNRGMFYEREPRICAAGVPSRQPDETVAAALQHYLLKDEADAMLSDAIIPPCPPRPLPPLRHPIPKDMRHAGMHGDVARIINPPNKTKFQTLVQDLKETAYQSYWKKPLGKVQDPIPTLPPGIDLVGTTFGKKTQSHGRLYDIVMPKVPIVDKTPRSKQLAIQTDRNYCKPPYNPDLTFGKRDNVDPGGKLVRCCMTDERIVEGNGDRTVINNILANYQDTVQPRVGRSLAPYDNVSQLPEGYSFGKLKPPDNLPECLTYCEINPGKTFFMKCLAHLNSLRKCLSKRFLPTFFRGFYLNLRYFDKDRTEWLPKEVVYDFCGTKLIRFDPKLIEPLLGMWNAFDGSRIEYKTFVHVINYREPSPEIPKIEDVGQECLDFRTTYSEMVNPCQPLGEKLMAGLPSGRYFDRDYPVTPKNCCKAIRTCLPHESDARSCLNPSILTLLNVSHRDMYAPRDQQTVRTVFEATGEEFSDERFKMIWTKAQKLHPQGLVCYETFRQILNENPAFIPPPLLSDQCQF